MKYVKMFKKLQYYFKHQENVNYEVSDAILTIVFGAFSDKEKEQFQAWIYAVKKRVPRQLTIIQSIPKESMKPKEIRKEYRKHTNKI